MSSSVDPSEVELFDREPFEDEELLGSWLDDDSKSVVEESEREILIPEFRIYFSIPLIIIMQKRDSGTGVFP